MFQNIMVVVSLAVGILAIVLLLPIRSAVRKQSQPVTRELMRETMAEFFNPQNGTVDKEVERVAKLMQRIKDEPDIDLPKVADQTVAQAIRILLGATFNSLALAQKELTIARGKTYSIGSTADDDERVARIEKQVTDLLTELTRLHELADRFGVPITQ